MDNHIRHFQIPIRSGIVKHFIMSLWLGWLPSTSCGLTLKFAFFFPQNVSSTVCYFTEAVCEVTVRKRLVGKTTCFRYHTVLPSEDVRRWRGPSPSESSRLSCFQANQDYYQQIWSEHGCGIATERGGVWITFRQTRVYEVKKKVAWWLRPFHAKGNMYDELHGIHNWPTVRTISLEKLVAADGAIVNFPLLHLGVASNFLWLIHLRLVVRSMVSFYELYRTVVSSLRATRAWVMLLESLENFSARKASCPNAICLFWKAELLTCF